MQKMLRMFSTAGWQDGLTESEDLSEWPLSWRTANEAVRARQPNSRHTPSHFSVWLVFSRGN